MQQTGFRFYSFCLRHPGLELLLIPHQANKRIIDATANRMGLSPEKVMLNIQRYGNTTAATIPLCLWDWRHELNKGDNIVLAAFGGGFTWGATLVKWAY